MRDHEILHIRATIQGMKSCAETNIILKAKHKGLGHDWVVAQHNISGDTILAIAAYVEWLEIRVNELIDKENKK